MGAAESGPSNIRKWLLESDLVDAIVALPTNMFFNTGIATYIWILDNAKRPERKGLVHLVDGTSFWTKMRKNLGSKGREISDDDRAKIVKLGHGARSDDRGRHVGGGEHERRGHVRERHTGLRGYGQERVDGGGLVPIRHVPGPPHLASGGDRGGRGPAYLPVSNPMRGGSR
ncbi:N-6 DNA methylase [Pseudonocardia xishanensis]|uniref:site-specific DNA-methyltransferase (adenine-specific) n=1 Tax=Pseudonocardia xishanensis TaxID=630995 RepID=A0ABP8RE82_9PSEU